MKGKKRMVYTERERREIMRGTSWLNPVYANYTRAQLKAEMRSIQRLLKKNVG